MAQHDYVIANGTGAAVRSDINNGLAAIVSQNSGTTEPATMYAYQWWADETTGLLKIRNAANNAWITVGTLASTNLGLLASGGTLVSALGSASTPGITFTGDLNTGIYSPGADQVSIATGGSDRVSVDASGNVTINAQGDLRFADSDSSNWVAFQAPGTVATNITWTLPDADGTSGQALTTNGSGTLSWSSAAAAKITIGNTEAEVVDTGVDGHFKVTTEGTEALRVDASQRLLVGTSTARANLFNSTVSAAFQIEGVAASTRVASLISSETGAANGFFLALARQTSGAVGGNTVVSSGDSLGGISFQGSDGTEFVQSALIEAFVDGTPGANDMPGRLVFSTCADGSASPTERMRLDQYGRLFTYSGGEASAFRSSGATNVGTIVLVVAGGASSTTTGTTTFQVLSNGNVNNQNGTYGSISDLKLKENVVDARSQWDDIKSLKVRNYNFKEETGYSTHTQIGLVAQEVELVSPGLVAESHDRDEDGNDLGTVTKSISYSVLYMKAVKALQEAMERIETLEAKIAALEAQ
jgi:hypothetical protein